MRFLRAGFVAGLLIANTSWMCAEGGIVWNVYGNWRQNPMQSLLRKG